MEVENVTEEVNEGVRQGKYTEEDVADVKQDMRRSAAVLMECQRKR